jgi:LuxR family transcriptional regulator, maltose regulon positive regulatory protein
LDLWRGQSAAVNTDGRGQGLTEAGHGGHHWLKHEPVLVDQAEPAERLREGGTSPGDQVLAGLAARGEERAAVDALAGALVIACPQGYVRVFADEGPPMAALFGRLITAQRSGQAAADVPLGYLARLQRAFDAGHPATEPGPAAVSGIVDPLTSREPEVLRMLAAGRSNQAIACELVVTLDTVKKHVGHLLGKLGAANRTEALARARELSMIP